MIIHTNLCTRLFVMSTWRGQKRKEELEEGEKRLSIAVSHAWNKSTTLSNQIAITMETTSIAMITWSIIDELALREIVDSIERNQLPPSKLITGHSSQEGLQVSNSHDRALWSLRY